MGCHLWRDLAQGPNTADQLLPPCLLLTWNIGRADDGLMRIDKEKSQNLSMPGFRGVRQMKRVDSVLDCVWESQKSTLLGDDFPKLLHARFAVSEAVDFLYGAEIALLVREIRAVSYLLAERQEAFGNVR